MMNVTQAMKMNITFCVSPMPNETNVSGISAAMGMLRPKIVSGQEEGLDAGEAAAEHAERDADERGQEEAQQRRGAAWRAVLRVSARSNHSSWKLSKRLRRAGQDASG